MTVALVAVGAALGAILLMLLIQWVVRRSSGDADERVTAVVRELEARMDEMVRELTGALEQAQVEGRRNRQLGELAGTIDLDEVLTRVLETAGAIPGADAALVTLTPSPGGQPIVATLGLSAEEAERQSVNGPPDGREARAISISYEYGPQEEQVTEGNRVASRWTLHGTHRGRRVRLTGIVISRFEDGQIVEDWAASDTMELVRQLGVWRSLLLLARHHRLLPHQSRGAHHG